MNWKSILRLKSLGVVLALALAVGIPVGYVAAAEDHHDYHFGHFVIDPIKTDAGYVAGTMVGDIGKEVRVYRGIPYAAPPVGDLRWKPPQPVTPWTGIRECTKFSLWAPQPFPTPAWSGSVPESGISEDCLYLNVLTPAKKTTDRLPVMVWFHGGGLTTSSGNQPSYNTPYLAQHEVVLVTVSHRLGALGYMAHPLLSQESPMGVSGNYGQLDLIAALKWVQKNITAFGGDPHNVTIFGESGGGSKTLWMMASPLTKGLFHRAICQSGGSTAGSIPLSQAEAAGQTLAAKLGVSDLAGLRGKNWQDIVKAGGTAQFTVDGWSLQDDIYNVFKDGEQKDIPFMIGLVEADIPLTFTRTQSLLTTMKSGKSKTFVYLFTQVPTGWRSHGLKTFHGLDVSYVFGNINLIYRLYGTLFVPPAGLPPDPGIDYKDEWVTDITMSLWAQFAETGDPSLKGLVKWPPYKYPDEKYLKIDYPLEIESGYSTLIPATN